MRIPKALIKRYKLANNIEINPIESGILIRSKKKSRNGWEEQLTVAIVQGRTPDEELL